MTSTFEMVGSITPAGEIVGGGGICKNDELE